MSAFTEASPAGTQVMCDMCVEVKTPALKTCLKCEISMCAEHLQAHLTTPVLLQTHPLTQPTASGATGLGASKCQVHGKLLEYYCLDDCISVCVSCAIEDKHRLHNMKTLSNAHKELDGSLKNEMKKLDEVETKSQALEHWVKEQNKKLKELTTQHLNCASSLQDRVLTVVGDSVTARTGAIRVARESVQNALAEGDAYVFLQKFSDVYKALQQAHAVDLGKGLEPGPKRDELAREIWQCVDKLEEHISTLQNNLLTMVNPEHHQFPLSEISFDPSTLGSGMSVSIDKKTLFYNPASCSKHTVFCQHNCGLGNLHCVVKLSDYSDWSVGLCFGTVSSYDRLMHGLSKDHSMHGLSWQNGTLNSLRPRNVTFLLFGANSMEQILSINPINITSPTSQVPQKPVRPKKIAIFWNSKSQVLSFHSRDRHSKGTTLYEIQLEQRENFRPFVTVMPQSQTGAYPHGRGFQKTQSTEILCEIWN